MTGGTEMRVGGACAALLLVAAVVLTSLQPLMGQEGKATKLGDITIRDPFILADAPSKTYYLYRSGGGGVEAYTSTDLESWKGPLQVFKQPDGFWGSQACWAPEVFRYKEKYYLLATFSSKDKVKSMTPGWQPADQFPLVLRGTQILVADSPKGPFKPFQNRPHTPQDWMALDGTLWVEDGTPWMVFCHEWVQVQDGTVEAVRLKDDLSAADGSPTTLFKASDAPWRYGQDGRDPKSRSWVTDGPSLYKTKSGKLLMIWSSFGSGGYTVGVARSQSGKVEGPWTQIDKPLFKDDGGHGMILRTFDDKLYLVLHQPNSGASRARLLEVEDTGDGLRLK
ncbi:MAG TPA: glycoside hydrolase family 43 protein [Armatimonadota bacterium]